MQLTKISFDLNQAKCLDEDPEIFFADDPDDEDYDRDKTNRALRACNDCPVKADCLQFAIKEKAVGVWGGTTSLQRRVIFNRAYRGITTRVARKDMSKNLVGHNETKAVENGAKMRVKLIEALKHEQPDEVTLVLAKLKIENPGMSFTELAEATGLSRDAASGKLRRLIRRNDERVS